MIITEPKKAVEMHKDERAGFLKLSRKENRETAIKLFDRDIEGDVIGEVLEYIRDNFDILLSTEQFIEISNLYPYERVKTIDELDEEAVAFMITHFFADSKILMYVDTDDNAGLKDEFYKMIKELARDFGYKVVE